jgi:hypothetical protein
MKRVDFIKYHQAPPAELHSAVTKIEVALAQFNLSMSQGKQKNVRLGDRLKDDLARLKTLIRVKELTAKKA